MQDSIQVVTKPEIDLIYYINIVIDFFVSHFPVILSGTKSIIGFIIGISIPVSILLFFAIIYSVERLKSIRKKESEIYDAKTDMGYEEVSVSTAKSEEGMARRWDTVQTHVESQNPNDWRQAVIEADIILGELLTKLGYKGEGIGEQLKRANKGDFNTLDDAWEAHKVRNELAHAGSDFPFSQHDARKVIHQYRKVFEEFFYI